MPLLTTTIGAYPKPDNVDVPDWFRCGGPGAGDPTSAYTDYMREAGREVRGRLDRATREVVLDQVEAGIDVPTDGEIRRDSYIYYHCRHIAGFDFETLVEKEMRVGAWTAKVPVIRGPVEAGAPFLPDDWRAAQAATDRPVKMTVPGPLTITDSVADAYYGDEKAVGAALAEAINAEVRALAEAGCRWIQVDEPLFARWPEKTLAYGIENLERCFHGVSGSVIRTMHMCCGYPERVDQDNYMKADQTAYFTIADALENSASVDAVSIEDAHHHNDLALLERFTSIKVIFGAFAIARSRVESVDEIAGRLKAALGHIDADRLIAAPDCGLGMLNRETAVAKLTNLVAAARSVG